MNDVEVLADHNDLCGESPIYDDRTEKLYWTDITGRRSYSWSQRTRQSELLQQSFEIAGFALREEGDFVMVNSEGFFLWDGRQNRRLIAAEADGRRCALNDCITDPEGRVFAGSAFYDPSRDNYPTGCLFRADPNGKVQVVDEDLRLSNGLGFSPDQTILYLADSAVRTIYAYDYRREDGSIGNRRTYVTVPANEGIPDGLTVDADGFVWSAQWFGGCLVRYDPDGKVERRVPIPATQTTSLTFGGPDLTDIFVTSASMPDALPLAPSGYSANQVYSGGKLFRLNLGIPGRKEYRAR